MNRVILHGSLKDTYGELPPMSVRDPAEAMRALCAQLPGFRKTIEDGEWYVVREAGDGRFALDETMLNLGMQNAEIHIVPAIEGAASQQGKGTAKVVLGIALIAASFFIPGAPLLGQIGLGYFATSTTAVAVGLAGLSLAFAGGALLLAPQVKMGDPNDEKDDKNSFIFSGAVNPSGQGYSVPCAFGRIRIGSLPVSTRIVVSQINIPENYTWTGPEVLEIIHRVVH